MTNAMFLELIGVRVWKTRRDKYSSVSTAFGVLEVLLSEAKEVGYDSIKIDKGICYICASSDKDPRIGGWPAIWHIVKRLGIHGGCGGHHSAQATTDWIKAIEEKTYEL